MYIIIGYFNSGTTLNKYANNIGLSSATIKRWINDYEMLKDTHDQIPRDAHPIIHSDRGMHYIPDNWIKLKEEYGYTRSMSRKGCTPGNTACEGYFGILKR